MIKQNLPEWVGKYMAKFSMPVYVNAKVTPNPLIPVIFSHGMGSNRTMNSILLSALASKGCMVFSIDHTDGSCSHYFEEGKDQFYKPVPEDDHFPK